MAKFETTPHSMTRQKRTFPVAQGPTESFLPSGGQATPAAVFWNRRQILSRLGLAGMGMAMAACGDPLSSDRAPSASGGDVPSHTPWAPGHSLEDFLPSSLAPRSPTARELVAHHNNFYEFLPGRGGDVEPHTGDFQTEPWSLEVKGACERPRSFDLENLYGFPHVERLYHFRCVERWAMNVPWVGFPLRQLLDVVRPLPEANWLAFVSAADETTMPGLRATPHYPWPYHEALRLDEAMHDLALLATGIYGAPLPKQHGAPVRLVVPWKYGYKSAKSLVSIELMEEPPKTFWSQFAPREYGLLSNVNPNIPHPRWNQTHSFWLRDGPTWPNGGDVFPTALFNGYEAEVAYMYPDEPRERRPAIGVDEVAR